MSQPINVSFEAHHTQQLVLASPARFVNLACGRRWGKDHLAAIKIITHSLSHSSPRSHKKYAYLNPVYNPQGKDSYRVFCEMAGSGGLIKKKTDSPPQSVTLINGDTIDFFSLERPENLRGGQYDGVIINEAGLVSDLIDIWNGPVAAMLLDRMGWAWLQGTPKGKGTGFHNFFMKGLHETPEEQAASPWQSFGFPTHTNPFMPRDELDRLQREMPEDIFAQEFLAAFIDGAGNVFRGLAAMMERSLGHTLWEQGDNCRVGVDVAKHTDWTVLTALSPDNKVIGYDRFNQLDWQIMERRILNFCSRYRGKVVMDVAGAGDPLYEALVKAGVNITPAKFTNERKAMWVQNLMMLIEDGVLVIPPPDLVQDPARNTAPIWKELEAYAYDITSTGRIRYNAPPGQHDDCVTSLYLAASEVPPLSAGAGMGFDELDLNNIREIGETSDALY